MSAPAGPQPSSRIGARPATRAEVAAVSAGDHDATLVDLLDRVIDRGVVVTGDVVLSVAGVDLVHVGLRLVLRVPDAGSGGAA